MRCIGFLINPVAGMGGPVGFKGTDGRAEEARLRGAKPMARGRAKITLWHLKNRADITFLTCSGEMGADLLAETGLDARVLYEYRGASSAKDTRDAVRQFIQNGAELILFCGGDGTARDVFDVTRNEIPILGIPAGVKMYSAVFAIDPETAAELVYGDGEIVISEREVVDVDEGAYRAGILHTRLYGYARVPTRAGKIQVSKQVFEEADEERAKDEIARFIHEVMHPDTLYILGAGTTTGSIAAKVGVEKTLLGVDVVKNGKLVAQDVDEKTLRVLVERERDVRIIISPIGAQGFIFGRGNQQISGPIIRKAGIRHVIVVASPHKLRETPTLYLDTGDQDLNREFGDSVQVVSGYRIAQRKKIFQHAVGEKI
jgi:predicted polyphosphate/ATP-dependent NAD kinase